MKRRLAIVLLLLAGGAIVNVAVAWACAIFLIPNATTTSQWTVQSQGYLIIDDEIWIFNGYRRTGCAFINAVKRRTRASAALETDLIEIESIPNWSLFRTRWATTPYRMRHEFAFGAPLHCMASHRDFDPATGAEQTTGVFAAPVMVQRFGPGRDLPTRVVLPGFIINTGFYALLLWLLFIAPFTARRMIRRRRGQCEKCAYPISTWGGSPVCTECGAAVPRKVEA